MPRRTASGPASTTDSAPAPGETRATGESRLWPLLPAYSVPARHFDELRIGARALRPFWEEFATSAGDLDAEYFAQAQKRVARQIEEHYCRRASARLTRQVRERIAQAINAADFDALARHCAGLDRGTIRSGSFKHTEIDDGVPL